MSTLHSLECPAHLTLMEWIKRQTRWRDHAAAIPAQFDPELNLPGLCVEVEPLLRDLQALMSLYPPVYWRSQAPAALWGMSLSYNPQAPKTDRHLGSFGHPRYRSLTPDAYFTVPQQERARAPCGDYLDSLGFRRLLPEIAQLPALNALLSRFAMPVVRCTVRVIDGTRVWPTIDPLGGMHCDDPPTELLRLNLCLTGSSNFGLQYQGHAPMTLQPGAHRVINSDVPHRVWVARRSRFWRVHLIIGLTPWLDYNQDSDTWALNAHFGKSHPYDLVRQGLALHRPSQSSAC